jgi:hypothetical protein
VVVAEGDQLGAALVGDPEQHLRGQALLDLLGDGVDVVVPAAPERVVGRVTRVPTRAMRCAPGSGKESGSVPS